MGISILNQPAAASGKTVKGEVFNSNSNWTAPANVNYVTVSGSGGGGGSGGFNNYNATNDPGTPGSAGGVSSFGNLLSIQGGSGGRGGLGINAYVGSTAGVANSGQGGLAPTSSNGNIGPSADNGATGTYKEATVQVTPSTTYAITIGAGGNGGNGNSAGAAGGSGWLAVEYEE